MRYEIDNSKLDRLKALIDERGRIMRDARRDIPRDKFGLMETTTLLRADDAVRPQQEAIRAQVAAIGMSLSGADEMLAYHESLMERHGNRYGDAVDHLWHGVHGWIE